MFQTEISGDITSDTIWRSEDSPILVSGHVVVPAGVTLTINEGVTIKLDTGKQFLVDGNLVVSGSLNSKVKFTSASSIPNAGDWRGIKLGESATANFKDCVIEYAGYDNQYAISGVDGKGELFVDRCSLNNNFSTAIFGSLYTSITNSVFENNGGSAAEDLSLSSNRGIAVHRVTVLQGNIFNGNCQYGVKYQDLYGRYIHVVEAGGGNVDWLERTAISGKVSISDNQFLGNYCSPLRMSVSSHRGGIDTGIVFEIKGNIFSNNQSEHSTGFRYSNTGSDKFVLHVNNNEFRGNSLGWGLVSIQGATGSFNNNIISGNASASIMVSTGTGTAPCQDPNPTDSDDHEFEMNGNTFSGNTFSTPDSNTLLSLRSVYHDNFPVERNSIFDNVSVQGAESTVLELSGCGGNSYSSPDSRHPVLRENDIHSNSAPYTLKVLGTITDTDVLNIPNNYWGTSDSDELANLVYDWDEDPALLKIDLLPVLTTPFNN